MAECQSRKIKGWRSVLDDAIAEVRDRFWNAPSHTVHIDGVEAPRADDLIDHVRWFKRIFGPERAIASAELKQLQRVKQKIRYAEQMEGRTREQTEEQREMRRVKDHERYLLRRAKQSPEDRQEQYAKVRAKRAAQTEAEREHERAMCRQWRARQGSEWRAKEAEKKRLRRAAKPEVYAAIDRRSKDRTKDARNERRRLAYKANPENHRARRRSFHTVATAPLIPI